MEEVPLVAMVREARAAYLQKKTETSGTLAIPQPLTVMNNRVALNQPLSTVFRVSGSVGTGMVIIDPLPFSLGACLQWIHQL